MVLDSHRHGIEQQKINNGMKRPYGYLKEIEGWHSDLLHKGRGAYMPTS